VGEIYQCNWHWSFKLLIIFELKKFINYLKAYIHMYSEKNKICAVFLRNKICIQNLVLCLKIHHLYFLIKARLKRDQHQQIELYCMSQEWKLPKAAAGCFHRPGGQRKKGKINIFNLNLNLNFNCDEIEQMKLSSLRSYCFMHTTFIVGAFLFSLNPIIPKLQWTLMC